MYIARKCDNCGIKYKADKRNLKRGWGLCCSKSCAAQKREKSRSNYNLETVKRNNVIRELKFQNEVEDYDPGDTEYWMHKDY